jgi:hypothetical protein
LKARIGRLQANQKRAKGVKMAITPTKTEDYLVIINILYLFATIAKLYRYGSIKITIAGSISRPAT